MKGVEPDVGVNAQPVGELARKVQLRDQNLAATCCELQHGVYGQRIEHPQVQMAHTVAFGAGAVSGLSNNALRRAEGEDADVQIARIAPLAHKLVRALALERLQLAEPLRLHPPGKL